MKSSVLSLTIKKLKAIYMGKKDSILSYFLFHMIFLVAMVLADFLVLNILSGYFDIQIKRGFMLTYVTLFEIGIMFYSKTHYLKKSVIKNHLENNSMGEYYSDILVFGYKNATHTLYFVIPFLIAYGGIKDAEILFYINTIISLLVLPMISVIISLILPDNMLSSTSRAVRSLHKVITNLITVIAYAIFYLLLNDFLAVYYPQSLFSFEFISSLLNFPITLDVSGIDKAIEAFLEAISVSTGIIGKNLFELTLLLATFVLLIKITGIIYKINKKSEVIRSKEEGRHFSIKMNNTKVFRLNFNIKCCLPRSPDYY